MFWVFLDYYLIMVVVSLKTTCSALHGVNRVEFATSLIRACNFQESKRKYKMLRQRELKAELCQSCRSFGMDEMQLSALLRAEKNMKF